MDFSMNEMLLFQRGTAPVCLVVSPGQFFRPVAGETGLAPRPEDERFGCAPIIRGAGENCKHFFRRAGLYKSEFLFYNSGRP